MRPFQIFFAIVIIAALAGCAGKGADNGQAVGKAQAFTVVEVPSKTVTAYQTYPASIEGTSNSDVRAKVSGYITRVLVDEGERVKKGQLLFKLETQSLSQDAEAAEANVNAAQVEVDKLKPLVEKGIISEVQLQTAQANLAQARSNYNSVVANIGYSDIRSPIDGAVGSVNFREGALVSPGDPRPLTTVSRTDNVYVFFAMNEKNYLNVLQNTEGKTRQEKIGNFPKVQLELVNGTVYEEEGTIETVTGQVDPSTGTVSFRAKFANPEGILANGNSGRIRIPKTYENVLVVPESATFEQQGITYAYKVQGDTLAVSVPLDVIDRVESFVVLEGGLAKGDKIVAKGVGKLRNNTPIKPRLAEFDSVATTREAIFK